MASSFYQFTISLFVQRNLPPDKRLEPMQSWVTVLLSPIQWMQKFYLDWFLNGTSPANYSISTPYSYSNTVYFNNQVWFFWNSKLNGAIGIQPSDLGQKCWVVVMDGKYGVYTRVKFAGNRYLLEMLLNNYFGTTPFPYPVNTSKPRTVHPPIYIRNNRTFDQYFKVFDAPTGTAIFGAPIGLVGIFDGVIITSNARYSIMIPSALYATYFAIFNSNAANTDNKFKSVIKDFIYAGLSYDVQQY